MTQIFEVAWNGGSERKEYETERSARKRASDLSRKNDGEVFVLSFNGDKPIQAWLYESGKATELAEDTLDSLRAELDANLIPPDTANGAVSTEPDIKKGSKKAAKKASKKAAREVANEPGEPAGQRGRTRKQPFNPDGGIEAIRSLFQTKSLRGRFVDSLLTAGEGNFISENDLSSSLGNDENLYAAARVASIVMKQAGAGYKIERKNADGEISFGLVPTE